MSNEPRIIASPDFETLLKLTPEQKMKLRDLLNWENADRGELIIGKPDSPQSPTERK